MINLPSQDNKQWNQPNNSDLFGNIFVSKNITFDDAGYLNLSYSPRAVMNEGVNANFDNVSVILVSSDHGYFTQTWDDPFAVSTSPLETRPTQITTTNFPAGGSEADAAWFGGLMVVSEPADVTYYDQSANTFTDTNISLTNDGQHQVVDFVSRSAVAIADVNTVKLYATPITATPTLITTLTIGANYEITSMCYFNQNLYIGTKNVYGGHAYMYVWNGTGTAAGEVYEADSNTIFSVFPFDNSIMALSASGALLRFNGGGFEDPKTSNSAFPIYYTDQSLSDENNISIYKNALTTNGGKLYILFSNDENNTNRLTSMPDGLWCYDSNVGLYHRYSLSNSLVQQETIVQASVNTTTNIITVTGNYPTGTEVVFSETFGLDPLVDGEKYFVINVSATTIKLATSLSNAIAGTAIDLITAGTSNKFVFFPNVDYGQYYVDRVTATTAIERPVSKTIYGTDALWAGEVTRRDNVSDYPTLCTASNGVHSRGYFITPKIFSSDVTNQYNLVTIKFAPMLSDGDKIIISYRTVDDRKDFINPSNWNMTWTSTTTFTSTETGWADAVVGNQVEVLTGAGAGLLAFITDISESSGTYTITLDDSYDNYVSGDIGIANFRNFIKWKTIKYGDTYDGQGFLSENIGAEGKFLQLKVELRGINVQIEELLVDDVFRLPSRD